MLIVDLFLICLCCLSHGGVQANSVEWLDMKHVWGATWCLVRGPLVGPFSVRLTTLSAQKALTARDVIPRNWKPTATYTSRLNFEAAL